MTADLGIGVVWTRSIRLPNGSYGVGVNIDGGPSWQLPPDGALRYASAVITRATQAEHEAAIWASLRERDVSADLIGEVVVRVRAERGENHRLTRPLRMTPGVAADGGAPLLLVECDGVAPWQWPPAGARNHAMGVLDVLAAADADELLHRVLTGRMELNPELAAAIVASLGDHWPAGGHQ